MSKRRDSKKRILQNGESQRKDGKYEFKKCCSNRLLRDESNLERVEFQNGHGIGLDDRDFSSRDHAK